MNPDHKYLGLAEKWMNGTITPEEEKLFAGWYNEGQDREVLIPASFVTGEEEHGHRIYQEVRRQMVRQDWIGRRKWIPAAAAAVLLLAGGLWWPRSPHDASRPVAAATRIAPVADKAQLTLANGTTVDLGSVSDGMVIGKGKATVDKQEAQLVYSAKASPITEFNTLSTPRGGMYAVVLSDGTKVWLNASSSLRYPTAFSGDAREVSLEGEAYFEIAPDPSRPFTVKVEGSTIAVLGTHFNVMAYGDEAAIKTTLLEGSVRVDYNDHSAVLSPGQQSQTTREGEEIKIKEVDVDDAVAWKNGIFQFNSEDIHAVMRKIARWYDVDVRFEGDLSAHFSGAVSRDADVSVLLRQMELTHEVHFRIEGKTIIVTP